MRDIASSGASRHRSDVARARTMHAHTPVAMQPLVFDRFQVIRVIYPRVYRYIRVTTGYGIEDKDEERERKRKAGKTREKERDVKPQAVVTVNAAVDADVTAAAAWSQSPLIPRELGMIK